jgi:hypothetical protein
MQTHFQAGFTVADSDTIESIAPGQMVFRAASAVGTDTANAGQTSLLYFPANATKTIETPLGYSSDNRLRIMGQVDGSVELNVTHPTLGIQTLTLKEGGFAISMRVTSISATEMAGRNTSMEVSMFDMKDDNTEEFS